MNAAGRVGAGLALVAASFAVAAAAPPRSASAPASAAAPVAAAASGPVEFMGSLEAGTTYVADMAYDARALRIWRPVREVRVAKNTAWTIDWTNLDRFAQLKSPATQAKPQRFRFRVVKNDVVSGSPALPWMATYRCEILAVEPVAGVRPSSPPPKKR